MKNFFFTFEFISPHKTVNEDCERKNFLFVGRILPNFFRKLYNNSFGMYALLMAMMSLFLISCDDPEPTMDDMAVSDEWRSMPDLSTLSKEELVEYFKEYKFGERGSPPMSIEITDMQGLPATPKIKTRNSLKCDVEITLTSRPSSSTDSANLEIYENDILVDSYKMYHTPKFLWEIDDANEYKYKIIPLGDTSHAEFDLKAGLKYGTKTIYPGITGIFTTYPETYTCPEPTFGNCEIELCTRKLGGDATGYTIVIFENDIPLGVKNTAASSSYSCDSLMIDDSNTYRFLIFVDDSGPNEGFNFSVSTPYLNYGYTFMLNSGTPSYGEVDNFTYFDCP